MTERPELQIIIVSGPDEAPRALTGFSLAAAASACGTRVVVFLVSAGVRWLAQETHATPVAGFATVGDLLDAFRGNGGIVEVCSNCAGDGCRTSALPRAHAAVTGLATVALRLGEIPTVTF